MNTQSPGNTLPPRPNVLIGGPTVAERPRLAVVCEVTRSIEQDRPIHSTGVRSLRSRSEPPATQNGPFATRSSMSVEQHHRPHDWLEKRDSWHPSKTRAGGFMVFDHKGRLVAADASAELVMAALGVESSRGCRLRIDALDTSESKPSAYGKLPDWLDPEWIEPVIEGSERLGTIVQIPGAQGSIPPAQGGLPAYKLRQIIEFIDAHIEQSINLNQLAAVASLSPFHFHREFKRSTGLTPGKYIFETRIKRARTLLCESDLPLAQVAIQVGFADQSHFTAAFRKATSMTPRNYRNSNSTATQADDKGSARSWSRFAEPAAFHERN
jgi:AraC-like DNA-binding protein